MPTALVAARVAHAVTADPDEAARTGAWLAASRTVGAIPLHSHIAASSVSGVTMWEYVASEPAAQLPAYSLTTPTTSDSVTAGNPLTMFMVETRTGTTPGAAHWFSAPDSGYSVDNLSPGAPMALTGQYAAGVATLHWSPSPESDFSAYRIYRGASMSFTPSPANLIAAPVDTGFTDHAGAPYVYKITAVDVHGNESEPTSLAPGGVLGVNDGMRAGLAFSSPSPNPATSGTTLRWSLPASGDLRLVIYDPSGRLVRTLVCAPHEAGPGAVVWDLRDGAGRAVAAGLYFASLETAGQMQVRRIAVTR